MTLYVAGGVIVGLFIVVVCHEYVLITIKKRLTKLENRD